MATFGCRSFQGCHSVDRTSQSVKLPSPRWHLTKLGVLTTLAVLLPSAHAALSFSLAEDFSYTENGPRSLWSYRLDDFVNAPPGFPLLTQTNRNANALWGSDFLDPPLMWSDPTGYWGIGKNTNVNELFSTKNGTRWAPGEILFHPKAGDSPSGLVVAWTAPSNMVIDVKYAFGHAAQQGNGIGYQVLKRIGGTDSDLVGLENIEGGVTDELTGIFVVQGDQLFFRFNTCGEPEGDISRADIKIKGMPTLASVRTVQPSGAIVTAGSDFTFSISATGAEKFQWRKDRASLPGATNSSYRFRQVKMSDAGAYSVVINSTPSMDAILKVTPKQPVPERYPSPTPRQIFSGNFSEQEQQLKTNKLMLRFAASRKRLASDPHRPMYHFVSPESQMNDPNGLCFWQGRWHLFYQAYPPDEFPDPKDIPKRRQHWGHAISDDLVHWRDLPYAIYPGVEKMCFSGGTFVERDQVVAFYPGINAGQMVAIAKDPLLLNWEKLGGKPVRGSPTGDSCIWKEGTTYFGLVSADSLVSSTNLVQWNAHGAFLEGNPFPLGDAGACPTFVPIGNKHLLLSFSHTTGGQYLLGDYDRDRHKFQPYAHGRFNHGTVSPGGVHAPSAAADGKDGVINILNINDAKPSSDWDQIMSLPQRLSLGPDSKIRIEPFPTVSLLRGSHRHVGRTILAANEEMVLETISGNTMELNLEIEPQQSRWVQLNVLRSPNAEEQTSLTIYNFDRKLSIWYDTKSVVSLDGTRSSISPDVWIRPPERAVMEQGPRNWDSAPDATAPGKPVRLRVFLDRSVVEVFVNEKLYLATRVYPVRQDSLGVSLKAQGQDAVLKSLDAWQMHSIWPTSE
jgi:beta-fructofuranosidase